MTRPNDNDAVARIDSLCCSLSRRNFLRNSGVAAGAAATAASVGLTFSPGARAAGPTKTLVYLFLRGGIDGLSMVIPTSGADFTNYAALRSANGTRMTMDSGDTARRPIALPGTWGLHPQATGLKQIWDANKLAIVHAVGHLVPSTYTRSHFDAQEQIELGTPGVQTSHTGWLARHLATTPLLQQDAVFTALVSSSNPPVSVAGWPDVATLESTNSFHPDAGGTYARTHLASLRTLYPGIGDLDVAAISAVNAVDLIASLNLANYVPGGGVTYPQNSGLGNRLRLVAQLIRQNIGISAATVDYGGWDTHNQQFNGYANSMAELSNALRAFYFDLAGAGRANDVTVIVQSEFGRQVTENADLGTDHGLGNPVLVIGGEVIGGFYGNFPGIANNQRVGDAVRPTTDFRQVLATVVDRLMDNPNVDEVFDETSSPFTYTPMGFAA